MTRERFAEKFKSEPVRQVVESDYTVTDVAERLGVSVQSIYKLVRVTSPSDKQKDKVELNLLALCDSYSMNIAGIDL